MQINESIYEQLEEGVCDQQALVLPVPQSLHAIQDGFVQEGRRLNKPRPVFNASEEHPRDIL
jgi:hypothetical protein